MKIGSSFLDRTRLWHLVLLAVLAGGAMRAERLILSEEYVLRLKAHVEMRNIALTLARTGEFADPYGAVTGKTAHLAPIAPFLTSLIYRVWGETDRAELMRGIACALVSSLVSGLTVLFGVAIGLDRLTSLTAGLLAALAPHGVQFRSDVTELDGCLGTALFIGAILVLLRVVALGPSPPRLAMFGVLAGTAILTYNSLFAPLAAFLVCAALPLRWNPLRLPLRAVLWMTILMSLMVLPWSLRNALVFKQWVTVRSNFGLEFRIAQNDLPPGDATLDIHPVHSEEMRSLIRKVGEPAAYAGLEQEGFRWIRDNPAEFAQRTAKRAVLFWFPGDSVPRFVASSIIAFAAFSGFALLTRARHPAAAIIGVLWISYPLVYWVLVPLPRYQQPIGFSLYLMASVSVVTLLNRLRGMVS